MRDFTNTTENITPMKAIQMLAQMGITVSEEQARCVLDFMYKMARLEYRDYLKNNNRYPDEL